jgi:hypothetical protein
MFMQDMSRPEHEDEARGCSKVGSRGPPIPWLMSNSFRRGKAIICLSQPRGNSLMQSPRQWLHACNPISVNLPAATLFAMSGDESANRKSPP